MIKVPGSTRTRTLAIVFIAIGTYLYYSVVWVASNVSLQTPANGASTCFSNHEQHPIDQLLCDAERQHQDLLSRRTTGLASAASAYRIRRGRHPPPGFDKWVAFAASKNSFLIEEFFDQIYHDLEPFWGLSPSYIRLFSRSYHSVISIRNGVTSRWKTSPPQMKDVVAHWRDMIEHIPSEDLPDVDMAFNLSDEPHMFVSWEDMAAHTRIADSLKHVRPSTLIDPIISQYSKYPPLPPDFDPAGHTFPGVNHIDTIWGHTQRACPPDSPARSFVQDTDMTTPASFPTAREKHFHRGFVSNWTSAKDACENPYLSNMHGTYINMQTFDAYDATSNKSGYVWTQLVPLFSYCKINGVNQDIIVPAAVYWPMNNRGKDEFTISDEARVPWNMKSDHVAWYGSASGGWNNESTWTRFHRHRLVSMLNGTQVAATEMNLDTTGHKPPTHLPGGDPELPHNFPLPDPKVYDLVAMKHTPSGLGNWIGEFARGFFVDLRCWPIEKYFGLNSANCTYNGEFYDIIPPVKHTEIAKSKYEPDLDGASFSGRYLSLLTSGSVPIKATIWSEWHDSRLTPWQHFVPMDNSFVDLWGIEEYFLGYKNPSGKVVRASHDEQGRNLGQRGSDWVKVALREEDMVIYMYRLILEFARISDENRVNMGFVDDLMA